MSHSLNSASNRRSPRRTFRRPTGVLIHGQYEICQSIQLSEGGIFVLINHELQVGAKLVVTIFIPGGGHALVRANVLYRTDTQEGLGYGMKFENLPLAQKRHIRNYVSAKTQEEAEQEFLDPEIKRADVVAPASFQRIQH